MLSFMSSSKIWKLNYNDRRQESGLGTIAVEKKDGKGAQATFGMRKMFSTLIMVVVSQVYTPVQIHLIYTLSMCCLFYMLCLNKVVKLHTFFISSLIKCYHN